MGIYYYALKTSKRRFVIGGQKVDVHPVDFFYKHETKSTRLTEARMEKAWEFRDPPEYVAFGGFEDETPVYRRWPVCVVVASEHIINSLEFVGVLRQRDGKLVMEEWTSVPLGRELDATESYEAHKAMMTLGIDPYAVRVYTPRFDPKETRVAFLHAKDAVIGKVALR